MLSIKENAFVFVNATRIKIMYDVEFIQEGHVEVKIRTQNNCHTSYVVQYVNVIDSSVDKVDFEINVPNELTTYYVWMFVNNTMINKMLKFKSLERPFNQQVVSNSSFSVGQDNNLYLYLKKERTCRNGDFGYHQKYQIETLPQLPNLVQEAGLFVFQELIQENDTTIIVKEVDSMGEVRVGKTFIIPKKLDRLQSPTVHARITPNTYEVSWIQPNIKEAITSYTVYWCKTNENVHYKLCDGSIKSKVLKATDNDYSLLSNGDTLRIAVAVNTEQSTSGINFTN